MKPVSIPVKRKVPAARVAKDNSFLIVAIGASAGGLDAVTSLLKKLPTDTGMAFIYVQHLSPDHKSILTTILSKSTRMKVEEVTNRILMRPNHFYVIPPDKEMVVLDGHIKLMPRRKDKITNLPIDTFFSSLAEKHGPGAIGVILSGNGSDGSRGIVSIKQQGGTTFAQDGSAKFVSMPESAVATGAVDLILPPEQIAAELIRLGEEFKTNPKARTERQSGLINSSPGLKVILELLHKETGVDFSHYKMATVKRRILRRMLLHKIKTLTEYAKLIAKKKEDISILYQDLLINVTTYFRDTDAHDYLKKTLLPKLLKSKSTGETLRIWIPACATGEEAYSIAMAILEIQGRRTAHTSVKIFATDLSIQALNKARSGEYTPEELSGVSPRRLQRFFVKFWGKYKIAKEVQGMCVFAEHNILRDPPFSRVDFISCCNLLIYLDTAAQKKVFSTFHYALNEGGFLMLGKSESAGTASQLFTPVNKKLKIYARKKRMGARLLPDLLPRTFPAEMQPRLMPKFTNKQVSVPDNHFGNAIDAVLLLRYMPASVVINHSFEILQFRGDTDHYLKHTPGKASLNILKLAAPEIAFALRGAIAAAIKTKLPVHKNGVEVKAQAGIRTINLEVLPLNVEWEEPLLFIVFTEPQGVPAAELTGKARKSTSLAKDRRIQKLEEDLLATRADMQAFANEQESFNEELQSANEEVVASNEELQSVNEELETSKEEIESANEELITTNQELQARNDLLNESYDYSESIIATLHEPMIILDKEMRVKSANRAFYKNFKVKEDVTEGSLLYDLGNKQWNIPLLRKLLEDIIPRNTHFSNFEVTHSFPGLGKKIMLLNARRILQKRHDMQLILLAIHDVTEVRNKTSELQRREREMLDKDIRDREAENIRLEKAVEARTRELEAVNKELLFQNAEKEKRSQELMLANEELATQNELKEKREAALILANDELALQYRAKEKWEGELMALNIELAIQNGEKERQAAELMLINKELEAFAYVSSHDLQEPLRKIQTFATRILTREKDNLSDSGKDDFSRMQKAATRMRVLIDDLLAYSRTNVTERSFENVDLAAIVEDVKEELWEIIVENKAIIESHNMCECGVIVFQFRQLMHNLLANALKFSSKHRPCVIIIKSSCIKGKEAGNEQLESDTLYCHISVADNGIGFEPRYNERIFEVFQKLHGKEEYPGTGIGLAIVKKIVENHQGIITATGEPDKGAIFDIFIPIPLTPNP